MLELICPQCQSRLTEVLDSDGGLFICRSVFHGKIAPSFTREALEIAQGIISVPSQPLSVDGTKCTYIKCNNIAVFAGFCENHKHRYFAHQDDEG